MCFLAIPNFIQMLSRFNANQSNTDKTLNHATLYTSLFINKMNDKNVNGENNNEKSLETTTLSCDQKFIGYFIVMRMYYGPQKLSQTSLPLRMRNSLHLLKDF